jgi:histidine triad (HIT) family protein
MKASILEGMENCIFCKIVSGKIPTNKVYEDEDFIAFLDNKPKVPGHTLLIPKEHSPWFYEMPDELAGKLFITAKKIAQELKEKHGADYIQLGIVGKDVPHTHVHLLPQKLGRSASAL